MKKSTAEMLIKILVFVIVPIVMFATTVTSIFIGIQSAIQYTELIDHAITVDAVVTKHDKISDDNDYDYVSYVSYTVNGVEYKDIEYETNDIESQLDPIGTTVKIKVNPENPEESMADIRSSAFACLVPLPSMAILGLIAGIKYLKTERSEDYVIDVVDKESIVQCFQNIMKTRIIRPFFFTITIYYVMLTLVFPIVFSTPTLAYISIAVYVYFLGKDLFRLICLKTSRYTLCKGRFEEKFETLNEDKETVYWIKYYFPDLKESKYNSVSYGEYQSVNERDRSYLVFFPNVINIDKPILNFYEINGKIFFEERI